MRKDNRDKQSGAAAILLQSSSGLTRGSRLNNKAIMFDVDSRVKPENDRRKKEPENDSTFVKGCHGRKRSGGAAVVTMSFCLAVGLGASEALAQCAVLPTCESLGYDLTSADCEGKRALKCPFDASKVFCSQTIYDDIAVGNIYYSDGTISDSVIAGKTPVGIVGYVTDGGKHGFVISLVEAGYIMTWRPDNDVSCLLNISTGAGATTDMDGGANTNCIMSQTNDTYPAAKYCNSYKPVSNGKGSTGWYLPAAGELRSISYSYGVINLNLSKLSGKNLSPDYYWSSSEYGYTHAYGGYAAWRVSLYDGSLTHNRTKDNNFRVRCFLAF